MVKSNKPVINKNRDGVPQKPLPLPIKSEWLSM
jgi:hypothetical protein